MICDYVISTHKIHTLDLTLDFKLLSFHFQFSIVLLYIYELNTLLLIK